MDAGRKWRCIAHESQTNKNDKVMTQKRLTHSDIVAAEQLFSFSVKEADLPPANVRSRFLVF
jgi:hypothetical protein